MRVYPIVMEAISVSAAKSLIVAAAPATKSLVLLEMWIEQAASETSEMMEYRLNRLSTAGAGTGTAYTPEAAEVTDATDAADGTYTVNFTAEPTTYNTNPVWRDSANILNGLVKIWTPEARIWVPPSGKIGLRLVNAPSVAVTMTAVLTVGEIG